MNVSTGNNWTRGWVLRIQEVLSSNLWPETSYPDGGFCDLPQSLQANSGTLPQIRPWPLPFQFIVHLAPFHSTLVLRYWKASLNKLQIIRGNKVIVTQILYTYYRATYISHIPIPFTTVSCCHVQWMCLKNLSSWKFYSTYTEKLQMGTKF
jgi:hypothetical protein